MPKIMKIGFCQRYVENTTLFFSGHGVLLQLLLRVELW